jgi:hypothetical protein
MPVFLVTFDDGPCLKNGHCDDVDLAVDEFYHGLRRYVPAKVKEI